MNALEPPYVLKADGLAAGKGVLICETFKEAEKQLKEMLQVNSVMQVKMLLLKNIFQELKFQFLYLLMATLM